MTIKTDMERLQNLVGKEFDRDDIICEMLEIPDEWVIIDEVEGCESTFEKEYGKCKLYNAYYSLEDATIHDIWVNTDNIIVKVNSFE